MRMKRSKRIEAFVVMVACALLILASSSIAFGQRARRAAGAGQGRAAADTTTRARRQEARQVERAPMQLMNPVQEGSDGGERIWSGVAPVTLKANDNPIIRIYMVQGGSTLVEVPDRDRLFAIHPPPAEPQLIVLEDSPTKATDRFFLIRPGRDFVVPAANSRSAPVPAATVTVQMRSGMTFTIVAYPARDLRLNVHRLVVMYNPAEVASARRQNNLASNLGSEEEQPTRPSAPSTIRYPAEDEQRTTPERQEAERLRGYALAAREEMGRYSVVAVANGSREFPGLGAFGREVSGLRVAASEVRNLGGNVRLAVVAVQNRRDRELRMSQSQPDLRVDLMNGRGGVAQQQSLKSLYFETTSSGGVIPARGVVVYAIVYEMPGGISSGQVLRAVVSEERSVERMAVAEVARR